MNPEHKFDGAGVCIYCDRCSDEYCCGDTEDDCDRRIAKQWKDMIDRIQAKFLQGGDNA